MTPAQEITSFLLDFFPKFCEFEPIFIVISAVIKQFRIAVIRTHQNSLNLINYYQTQVNNHYELIGSPISGRCIAKDYI